LQGREENDLILADRNQPLPALKFNTAGKVNGRVIGFATDTTVRPPHTSLVFLTKDAFGARLSRLEVRDPLGCTQSQRLDKNSLPESARDPCVASIRSLRFRFPILQAL